MMQMSVSKHIVYIKVFYYYFNYYEYPHLFNRTTTYLLVYAFMNMGFFHKSAPFVDVYTMINSQTYYISSWDFVGVWSRVLWFRCWWVWMQMKVMMLMNISSLLLSSLVIFSHHGLRFSFFFSYSFIL